MFLNRIIITIGPAVPAHTNPNLHSCSIVDDGYGSKMIVFDQRKHFQPFLNLAKSGLCTTCQR